MKTVANASLAVLALSLGFTGPLLADQFDDAQAAFARNDYATASRLFHPLAEQGNVIARSQLGFLYAKGLGVPRDDAEAVKWFALAADNGEVHAQNNLGLMYFHGNGVKRNYNEAVKLFRLAAERGLASAQDNLGVMYLKGKGVQRDYDEALKLFRLAAEQGVPNAMSNLAVMYQDGKGVAMDRTQAYKWFVLAAAKETDTKIQQKYLQNLSSISARMSRAEIAKAKKLPIERQLTGAENAQISEAPIVEAKEPAHERKPTNAEEIVLVCTVECKDMEKSPNLCKFMGAGGIKDEFLLTIGADGEVDTDGNSWVVNDIEFKFILRGLQDGVTIKKTGAISRISGEYSEVTVIDDGSDGGGFTRKGRCETYEPNQKKF